jgi:carboxypeptidase Q
MRKTKIGLVLFAIMLTGITARAQTSAPPKQGSETQDPRGQASASQLSIREHLEKLVDNSTGAWTSSQIATMARLRDLALTDPYALAELRHLTDNIGPRISGSPQAQKAVEYVAEEMRRLGAVVTLERTTVPHWVRGVETAALVAWPGQTPATTQKIVLTALGGSGATPSDGLDAEVIVVKTFDEAKQLPPGVVKGKILLFNEIFDKQLAAEGFGGDAYEQAVVYRAAGPMLGANEGAAAVLVRSVGGADYRLPHTGLTFQSSGSTQIPSAAVTAEDAELLANLTKQGSVRMRLTLTPQTLNRVESYNVIADWKGTQQPDQFVIVSGHLDSWDLGTGAIDDGAGVAVSMQAIHLLQQLGIHAKRTIRFIAWMNEEQGADGAQTYANEHASDLQNHVAAIESDMGAGHPVGFHFLGKPELEEFMRPVARVLEVMGAGVIARASEVGSDVNPLNMKGVPGFSPIQDLRYYFNYHHTAADTFDKVDPRELNENAAVMAVLGYALADSATPAPR